MNDKQVKMYTCGPTVWNYPHIGNYRTFLFEDFLRRFLEYEGYTVTQVMNLTDVDDRIIKMCRENGYDLKEFTEKYAKSFFEDLEFLRVEPAEFYPRATENIPEMVTIIQGLLDKGIAYKSEDGSIYYSIAKFPAYGQLSGIKPAELKAGARVAQDDYDKESAQDFALWKSWDELDGKIFWDTPLGRGRPGWHIECSAMSIKYLGEQFDIHTGGVDNIFPHHENEIAQSEGYTGKKFARYWLHSEHLLINATKMSKRLGNIIIVKDLRERGIDVSTLRYFLLSGHYRAQLNFTDQSLEQASSTLKRINEFASRLKDEIESSTSDAKVKSEMDEKALSLVNETRKNYLAGLENDLDSPAALAAVFEFITQGNKILDHAKLSKTALEAMSRFLNYDFNSIYSVIETPVEGENLSPELLRLLREREVARKNKDWAKSDQIRNKLSESGIEVQDTAQGQKWRLRKKSSQVTS